jgi:aspartyl-tRNA(Asn)/glutamyl-tRNA(Gln) amidotransferase subunit C
MQVDEKLVRRIAGLARIKIKDSEVAALQGELGAILEFVEQLEEVDTTGVEPMTRVTDMPMRQRKDEVADGGYPEDIVKNAPLSENNFFLVPKVVE